MHTPLGHSSPLRILVVDDDALNLRVAARLLKELGHSGALVTDGEKALSILTQKKFDLILLDVNMPVLDGWSTLQALRRTPNPPPVLMVSGDDHPATTERFLTAGAVGFLCKPLSNEALRIGIKRALNR